MPFTYVTYNPGSRDNNLCDKRILAITNLKTQNKKKNKPKKCSVEYFLNCSYRLGRLKRQQTSDKLRFLHRSYMRAKQNGGLLLREKQARQLSTCLSKPLTAKRCSHRLTIEPWNHGTKNLKSLKNMVCCRLMPSSNDVDVIRVVIDHCPWSIRVYRYMDVVTGNLFCVVQIACCSENVFTLWNYVLSSIFNNNPV